MVTHINSLAYNGVNILDVDVQVHLSPGVPQFTIVGLADKTIAESKERVKAAITSLGLALPSSKILVNLAPADLIKEGSHYDLPIAVGIMAAMGIISKNEISDYLILGELSLDGSILPVAGVLPAAMGAVERDKGLICPASNGKEAAWSGCNNIIAANNLLSIVNHFNGTQVISVPQVEISNEEIKYNDFADIVGQSYAKKAMEVTAAGGHNLLMYGPPGTGKSMLAQRIAGILPDMSTKEILECSTIYSIAGMVENGKLTKNRPFRAPHHSCSVAAMVGGGVGRKVKPGEISLAHNGVLFLDELPEFPSSVIESLRQPIETKEVLISRANSHIKYPANFQLIAAMNPCKCGYFLDEEKTCHKAPKCAGDYMMKISGPMLDRFDIHVEVGSIKASEYNLHNRNNEEKTETIAKRVKRAREIQLERFDGYKITTNSQMDGQVLIDFATPDNDGLNILNEAAIKFKMSMRSYNRIMRVARTIADLEESRSVRKIHIAEAISYKNQENRYV